MLEMVVMAGTAVIPPALEDMEEMVVTAVDLVMVVMAEAEGMED